MGKDHSAGCWIQGLHTAYYARSIIDRGKMSILTSRMYLLDLQRRMVQLVSELHKKYVYSSTAVLRAQYMNHF